MVAVATPELEEEHESALPEPVPLRLTKADAKRMAENLTTESVRWLVDDYYQIQDFRKAAANQQRAAGDADEPSSAQAWLFDQMAQTEAAIKRIMEAWTELSRPGRWLKAQVGIGPVLAAGMLASFDPMKLTVGSWWRFAGLDPTLVWNKGQKRPYNAKLKTLMWKVSDSFVKVSNRSDAFYGQLYRQRKAYELERDTRGGNAETARETLAAGRIQDKATLAKYEAGHLPDGRLDLRARRYVSKMLLAHLHEVMWRDRTGGPPPAGPYAIDILKHAHLIAPPHWPID